MGGRPDRRMDGWVGGRMDGRTDALAMDGWMPLAGGAPLSPPSPPVGPGRAGAAAPLPPRGHAAAPRPRAAAAAFNGARGRRRPRPVPSRPVASRPWRTRCRCCWPWRWASPPPPSPRTSRSCSTAGSAAGSTGKRLSAPRTPGENRSGSAEKLFIPTFAQIPGGKGGPAGREGAARWPSHPSRGTAGLRPSGFLCGRGGAGESGAGAGQRQLGPALGEGSGWGCLPQVTTWSFILE